ncbi:uncharacterized protein BO66DRAFT_61646 [Aspergillus aculeatinus CBS 121060]|uniref:Uncharacterized protein n=1 Tax=Aspergillus aculeatinus CBS 121060 TaxID=1448322 RepID=A0ACD1HBW7_9EURO|nr:hypothetical protein BO66DRAFT_61646 [Aspergillus aculeatinus CBS 121060]RAH70997.1 hypothetical protein BO66DRAFT_61646 [Aspergillus aculeatinus CBS 121060]
MEMSDFRSLILAASQYCRSSRFLALVRHDFAENCPGGLCTKNGCCAVMPSLCKSEMSFSFIHLFAVIIMIPVDCLDCLELLSW